MSMRNRLAELERRKSEDGRISILFMSVGRRDEPDAMHTANVVGVNVVKSLPEESHKQFLYRAYATRATGKSLDELTEDEREIAFAKVAHEVEDHGNLETVTLGAPERPQ